MVLYSSFMVIVPPMPNLYTLIMDCLGFLVSGTAAVFLLHFLWTRPPSQKNILNRIIICIAIVSVIAATRSLGISITACFWNSHLHDFIETHPTLALLLSYRYVSIFGTSWFLALCTCRLVLVIDPVAFQSINPKTTTMILCSVISIICTLDFIYGNLLCSGTIVTRNIVKNFKVEIGDWAEQDINLTSSDISNNITHENDEPRYCFQPPIVVLALGGAVLLEIIKLVICFIKQFKKLERKKKNKVIPFVPRPVPRAAIFKVRRRSLPSFSPISTEANTRRQSLPVILIRRKLISAQLCLNNVDLTNNDMAKIRIIFQDIVQTFCVRASTFYTIFALFTCLFIILLRFKMSSFTLVGQLICFRLVIYVLTVYLVVFDNDIFMFIMQKLHLNI